MRLDIKPAAASAAAAFLLLLILDLTWPGHGVWLLVVGILLAICSAALWYRDRLAAQPNHNGLQPNTPFADVGAYGLSGAAMQSLRQQPTGVPVAGVMAPVAALAILLFIGGAIGSGETETPEIVTTLQQDVAAIDRSGDSALSTPQVRPPSAHQTQQVQTSTTVTAISTSRSSAAGQNAKTTSAQASEQVKPIVVAAPQPASAAEEEPAVEELDPRALNAIEYTVEEGDTLYDIAERYGSTVEAIMDLNKLDAFSFIHPGDVLLIPQIDEQSEETGEES